MDKSSDIYHLSWALCVVLDGEPDHNLQNLTGLSESDCKMIAEIRNNALPHVRANNWVTPEQPKE